MDYINREIERKILNLDSNFKALMVTGARQVGKTTVLKHLANSSKRRYVTLDNIEDLRLAKEDPKIFFEMYKPPVLIDEAQRAPEIFLQIKLLCDASENRGNFWLTGSESLNLIKNAGDSLAGRLGICSMYGLSHRETLGKNFIDLNNIKYGYVPFDLDELLERERNFSKKSIVDIFDNIWRGCMPDTTNKKDEEIYDYYNSYVNSYLIRDAVDDNGVTNTYAFLKLLTVCAANIGNIINYSSISKVCGITVPTVLKWLNILERMGIIYLLQPFYGNTIKRLIKSPKIYFCDTGLARFLTGWTTREALLKGAANGHYFENYVVMEIVKLYTYSGKNVNLSFYRDSNQNEVDLFIEFDNTIHPIEIKMSSVFSKNDIENFGKIDVSGLKVGNGLLVCMTDKVLPIDANNFAIPCNII